MKRSAIFLSVLFCACTLAAKGIPGYTGLYMGHSFFQPSVRHLEMLMPDTRVTGHKQWVVRAGGAKGSPGYLWSNEGTRNEGQKYLDTGEVDLLVLTYFSPENSSIEHYSKWIDYALEQNPDTIVMMTMPWGRYLYKADQEQFVDWKNSYTMIYEELIVALRNKYPNTKVLYCPYGWGTLELVSLFWAGELPGINYLLNEDPATRSISKRKNDQLLNDKLGHPGDLVAKLGALLWLQTIYDYDISSLEDQNLRQLPDIDVLDIAENVYDQIKHFNAVYITD